MPIITPAYPSMCATHNVTESTQMIMTDEFKKGLYHFHSCSNSHSYHRLGADIVDKVIVGSASWSDLFAKHDFFHKYRYYLQVIASTGNPDLQIKWWVDSLCTSHTFTSIGTRAGTVESRLRQLVMKLEFVESLTLAHPFIKGFDQVAYCLNEEEVRAVAQGEMTKTIETRKKEDIAGKEGAGPVYSTTFYIGLLIEPKQRTLFSFSQCKQSLTRCLEAGSVGPRRLDISYPTLEFQKQVKMWEKFSDSTMGIIIRHIKRFDCPLCSVCLYRLIYLSSSLPDYVFDPGERPTKLAQKRTKVGNLGYRDKVD